MWLYRKRGVTGLWSKQEREILLGLLIHDQHYKTQRVNLCKLPVWMWLYWAEEANIASDQMKSAMGTWASSHAIYSQKNARRSAAEIVSTLAVSSSEGNRREIIHDLTDMAYHGQYPGVKELCELLESIMVSRAKRNREDQEQSKQKARRAALLIIARVAIVKALAKGKNIPEALWLRGHNLLQSHRQGILTRYEGLTNTEIITKHLFTDKWDITCISACYHLATALGLGLLESALAQPLIQDTGEQFPCFCTQPLSRFAPSSLLSPNGIANIHHLCKNLNFTEAEFAEFLQDLAQLPEL